MINLTDTLKSIFINTAKKLKGSDKRRFMAEVAKNLGKGGQTLAEKELGWNRGTIRKGTIELEKSMSIADSFKLRGRLRTEEKLPNLLLDIISIVDRESQTDPTFEAVKLYTRMSSLEVRRQLIEQKGYSDEELPSVEIIRQRLNQLGYKLKKVSKTKPIKKIPETGAIFEEVNRINFQADEDPTTLRISMDAKVGIKVGEFDRRGKIRIETEALLS